MNTNLPIYPSMDKIVEAVRDNETVVITAETGSGKSTQVPQYLYNSGYNIICTQPRRIACVTLADRVAKEMGTDSEVVGYHTAFESTLTPQTKILFCTDGLQLARGIRDSNSVLIIDELHEWNLNIETLVAWIKKFRKDGHKIKVVLMSATIDAKDLIKFYSDSSIKHIDVPGRLFPVKKEYTQVDNSEDFRVFFHKAILDSVSKGKNVLAFRPGKKEISDSINILEDLFRVANERAIILPMHGELPIEEQNKCFRQYHIPKVVVATNIAQTSITIPDINVVVDDGIEKWVETDNGIENLTPHNISLADIQQRAGRAGRVAEGEYFLFSTLHMNMRAPYATAEINRLLLDKVVLKLYSVGIDAEEIEFYHQPEKEKITEAKELLQLLGAINEKGITEVGKSLIGYPVSVRSSKIIEEAKKQGIVDDMLKVVSIIENNSLLNFRHEKKDKDGFTDTTRYRDFTDEKRSDLLAELDIFEQILRYEIPDLKNMGINKKTFLRTKDFYNKLKEYVDADEYDSTYQERDMEFYKKFLKCLYAGNPDRVFQDSGQSYHGVFGNFFLSKNTCVRDPFGPSLALAFPRIISYKDKFDGCMRTLTIIDNVSKFPTDWIGEILDPSMLETVENDPLFLSFEEEFLISTDIVYLDSLSFRVKERRIGKNSPEFRAILNVYKKHHPFMREVSGYLDEDGEIVPPKQTHIEIAGKEFPIVRESGGSHVYFHLFTQIPEDRHEKYVTDDGETIILHYDVFQDVNPDSLLDKVNQARREARNKRVLNVRKIKEVKSLDIFEYDYQSWMGEFQLLDDEMKEVKKYYGLTIKKGKVWTNRFDTEEEYLAELNPALQQLFRDWVSENCKTSEFCFTKHGKAVTNKSTEECKSVFLEFRKEVAENISLSNFYKSKDYIKKVYQECLDAMEENPW